MTPLDPSEHYSRLLQQSRLEEDSRVQRAVVCHISDGDHNDSSSCALTMKPLSTNSQTVVPGYHRLRFLLRIGAAACSILIFTSSFQAQPALQKQVRNEF